MLYKRKIKMHPWSLPAKIVELLLRLYGEGMRAGILSAMLVVSVIGDLSVPPYTYIVCYGILQ